MVAKWPSKLRVLNLSSKQEEGKRHPAVLLPYFSSVLVFGGFVCLNQEGKYPI